MIKKIINIVKQAISGSEIEKKDKKDFIIIDEIDEEQEVATQEVAKQEIAKQEVAKQEVTGEHITEQPNTENLINISLPGS